MDSFFAGKRALVTGAGQGIGREISLELAKKGAEVIALSRTEQHLISLKKEAPKIKTICVDISNWENTKNALKEIEDVDLLVNNAAVALLQSFGNITEKEVDSSFAVNVKAVINVSQIIAEGMKRRGGGSIVNLSSQASMIALQNHTVYCATKGALDQLTKVMALALSPFKIRVNSVNPTVVLTEMGKIGWGDPAVASAMKAKIPLGKFCVPEDVVKSVMFLLSDDASMITGIQLPIDGGYTAV